MIFVTVGTHHQPFQRLLDGLAAISESEELIVQHGTGAPPAGVARAEPYMPFDRMLECYREADRVITHAGVGSVLCAAREGHVPLVVPRRHDLGEHVDEHQAELTRALAGRGRVIAVWEVGDLPALLAQAPARGEGGPAVDPALIAAVRTALSGAASSEEA